MGFNGYASKKCSPKKPIERTYTVIDNLTDELSEIKDDIDSKRGQVLGLEQSLKKAKTDLKTLEIKQKYLDAAINECKALEDADESEYDDEPEENQDEEEEF